MSIKELREEKDFFAVDSKKEIIIESNGRKLTFYANAIGYLENQNIGVSGARGKNSLAMLVAESITDAQGNKFTLDEVLKLRKEFAEPFLEAALEVNAKGQSEKK